MARALRRAPKPVKKTNPPFRVTIGTPNEPGEITRHLTEQSAKKQAINKLRQQEAFCLRSSPETASMVRDAIAEVENLLVLTSTRKTVTCNHLAAKGFPPTVITIWKESF